MFNNKKNRNNKVRRYNNKVGKFNEPSMRIADSIVDKSLSIKKGNPAELYFSSSDKSIVDILDRQGMAQSLGTQMVLDPYYLNGDRDMKELNRYSLPGLMAIRFSPAYGYSSDVSSALNQAGLRIYQQIRSRITSKRQYYASDVMLYFIAMDSVVMFYYYLKRLYGITNMPHDGVNTFIPEVLFRANLVDFQDMYAHKTDLYNLVVEMERTITSWDIPGFISLYDRRKVLLANAFQDLPSRWAQMYMFVPEGYYEYFWGDQDDSFAGKAKYHKLVDIIRDPSRTLLTVDDLRAIWIERFYKPLSNDGWIQFLQSDLRATYGQDHSYHVEPCSFDYMFDCHVYSEDLLNQVHNATLLGLYADGGGDVRQVLTIQSSDINLAKASGYLTFMPTFDISHHFFNVTSDTSLTYTGRVAFGLNPYLVYKLIDSQSDDMSTKDLVESTRFSNIGMASQYLETMSVETCGCEVAHVAYIYYFDYGITGRVGQAVLTQSEPIYTSMTEAFYGVGYTSPSTMRYEETALNMQKEWISYTGLINKLSKFRNHPYIYMNGVIGNTITSDEVTYLMDPSGDSAFLSLLNEAGLFTTGMIGEVTVPRIVNIPNLKTINYYVLLHMLAVINNSIVDSLGK